MTPMELPVIQPGQSRQAWRASDSEKVGISRPRADRAAPIALAARQPWPTSLVIARWTTRNVLEIAMRLHAIDVARRRSCTRPGGKPTSGDLCRAGQKAERRLPRRSRRLRPQHARRSSPDVRGSAERAAASRGGAPVNCRIDSRSSAAIRWPARRTAARSTPPATYPVSGRTPCDAPSAGRRCAPMAAADGARARWSGLTSFVHGAGAVPETDDCGMPTIAPVAALSHICRS